MAARFRACQRCPGNDRHKRSLRVSWNAADGRRDLILGGLHAKQMPEPADKRTRLRFLRVQHGTAWSLGDLTNSTKYRVRSGTAQAETDGRGGEYRRFSLSRWRLVRFDLRNLSSAGLVNLRLTDMYGNYISFVRAGDGHGYYKENSLVRDLGPGTYFIHVTDQSSGASRTPRYQLRYRREPTPPRGTTHATAWYIGNLTSIIGKYRNKYATVHQGIRYDLIDTDYRRFTLTETRTIRFELRRLSHTVSDSFFASLRLGIEDANGRRVGGGLSNTSLGRDAIDDVVLGPGTYYITVNAYHIRDKDDTMRYHLRYLTKAATGPPRQSLWRDDAVAAGPASRLDEKRHLANAGGSSPPEGAGTPAAQQYLPRCNFQRQVRVCTGVLAGQPSTDMFPAEFWCVHAGQQPMPALTQRRPGTVSLRSGKLGDERRNP